MSPRRMKLPQEYSQAVWRGDGHEAHDASAELVVGVGAVGLVVAEAADVHGEVADGDVAVVAELVFGEVAGEGGVGVEESVADEEGEAGGGEGLSGRGHVEA